MYLDHNLDLSRSHDVIGDVTIRLALCEFLGVSCWHRPAILNCFGDIKPEMYTGRDLDLSEPRDVIGHVTMQFPFYDFL